MPNPFSQYLQRPLIPMSLYLPLLRFHIKPFYLQLLYFLIMSLFGFIGLKTLNLRNPLSVFPTNLDLFYTSVSASTVSSMTALEMEIFSNSQLILITFLMFVGSEVFTSMLELFFHSFRNRALKQDNSTPITPIHDHPNNFNPHPIELGLVSLHHNHSLEDNNNQNRVIMIKPKYDYIKCLGFVVLGYLVLLHLIGSGLLSLYIYTVPSARQVLRKRGINVQTFSVFTIVSTFASCGFVPTNENMMVFKKNPGLLLIVLPYVFVGNTLYPPLLRLVIWVSEKVTKREELCHILKNYEEMGYDHLLSGVHCCLLVATVLGLNLIQMVFFCCMEWNSDNMKGLNGYQKLVASLFQTSNARHSGESVFDLSTLSSAILVLFVVMMYLPPYTTYMPMRDHENESKKKDRRRRRRSLVECLVFSQLSYLVIFIILICITERRSIKEDPLNFNVLDIIIEVVSAYGNVGFSTGYSCERRLKDDGMCRDSWIGFSGRWSNKGKFILIVVMFFGRLKKFNMKGGKAWHLS